VIITLTINGVERDAAVSGAESLLFTLRERLDLPGSKNACEQGECGSCSVIFDGTLLCSCLVMAADADGASIVTVEGMAEGDQLHPVQQALLAAGGVQCGFCTPGFVVAAADLFTHNPAASRDDIREALSGNICRCTGYGAILRALEGLAASPASSASPSSPASSASPAGDP
jgi:carbon-monoxide dehydrogenase small subunit